MCDACSLSNVLKEQIFSAYYNSQLYRVCKDFPHPFHWDTFMYVFQETVLQHTDNINSTQNYNN